MVYHAYLEGYSVLPKLKKLNGPIFRRDENWERYKKEKELAICYQQCFHTHEITLEMIGFLHNFIKENYPVELKPGSFYETMMQIQEDIALHCISDEKDWMALAHICFPSSWLPEEKIGKDFIEIHQPVAGMKLDNSRKLVEAMIYSGPFERYVWSIIFEDRINGHPLVPKAKFDPKNPKLFVKVEKQTMYGFPEHKAAAFILRLDLIPEPEINKSALAKALSGMTEDQKRYKGYLECYDDLMEYLNEAN